jgi:cardiolipin synthase (CMP-forming)
VGRERIFTVPGIFTFYRLLSLPLILWFIFSDRETLFVIFLLIGLITDALDGYLARKLDQVTELGARLDSIADKFIYALAVIGIIYFKWHDLLPYVTSFTVFIFLGIAYLAHSFIKFGKMSTLHTYATKIGGYLHGIFFFVLFAYDFIPELYYFIITWGILSILEMLVIQMIIPDMRSNVKGLYWILKDREVDYSRARTPD